MDSTPSPRQWSQEEIKNVFEFFSFTLRDEPKKYWALLVAFEDFYLGRITTSDFLDRAAVLFGGQPELLTCLNYCLPDGHKLPGALPEATYEEAKLFIFNVKQRFQDDQLFFNFADIILAYQRGDLSCLDFYSQTSALLTNHPDLIAKLKSFIPVHVMFACERPQPPPTPPRKSIKRSANELCAKTHERLERPPSPPSKSIKRSGTHACNATGQVASSRRKTYLDTKETDTPLPAHRDKKQKAHIELGERTDSSKHERKRSDAKRAFVAGHLTCYSPVSDVEKYSAHPRCTPSYYLRLCNDPMPPASDRTKTGAEVLNYVCKGMDKLITTDPVKRHKSKFEEAFFRCEKEMYEMDMLIQSVESTIESLTRLEETMNVQPIRSLTLTTRNLRCIETLYGDYGLEVVNILRTDACRAVPCILARLKQKREEHKMCHKEFQEAWNKVPVCLSLSNQKLNKDVALKEEDLQLDAEDEVLAGADTEKGDGESGSVAECGGRSSENDDEFPCGEA